MANCMFHGPYNSDGPGCTDYCPPCESGDLPTEVVFVSECCEAELSPPFNPNAMSNIVKCQECYKGYFYFPHDKFPPMKEKED